MMAALGQQITGALRGSCRRPGFRRGCQASLEQQVQTLRLDSVANQKRFMTTGDYSDYQRAAEEQINAAPALDLNSLQLAKHARAIPVSPSYFSRQSQFNDSYIVLQKLAQSFKNLPRIPTSDVERVNWSSLENIRQMLGEPIRASDYAKCMKLVKDLHAIHPQLKAKSVVDALEFFKHHTQGFTNVAKPIPVDKFGRAVGVGKRKSSVACAWVVEGTGEIIVNGKTLAEAFGRVHDRESAIWALRATDRVDKYNVWAVVEGGGTTGQAEALTLAVAKGLMAHEPALKPALRRAGCVTRDPRKVERKKAGHVKARKSPTWVKR
ncbi:mitochondrial 37S ribosomal protein MRPS9 [Rhypophila sp. PSN 637]